MKKRMLALLLTLCMVVSLLPAQIVVAEGETATVTILGNSKTVTLCDSNGVAVAGPDLELTVSIPVGSSLGAEGYSIVFAVEDGDPLGWTVHPNTALETTAEVLAYTINGDTTFEPGWPGAGGGDEEPEPQYNMGFVTEADALFIVYPVDGEPWNTNGFADYVEAGKKGNCRTLIRKRDF